MCNFLNYINFLAEHYAFTSYCMSLAHFSCLDIQPVGSYLNQTAQ